MDYILYFFIFILGTVFGSFFTLAVYRIPLRQDILHTRSYCPNCNHKLSFLDLIPVWSYTFLGGKCRYCKTKIRPRYLLLEILSGITFVLFAVSVKFSVFNINADILSYIITGILYISTLFIIAGIDKENIKVEKPVLLFGFICVTMYMIYLYIFNHDNDMYRYVIYLALAAILTLISTIILRKKTKDSYVIDILLLINLMVMFTYEAVSIYSVTITLLAIALGLILKKICNKKETIIKDENTKIPIAFYICTANIITLIWSNFYIFYIID